MPGSILHHLGMPVCRRYRHETDILIAFGLVLRCYSGYMLAAPALLAHMGVIDAALLSALLSGPRLLIWSIGFVTHVHIFIKSERITQNGDPWRRVGYM